MKYVVLVSHGEFADWSKNILYRCLQEINLILLSAGLKDGMDADTFAKELLDKLAVINQDDKVILLGDLVGGSPLTTAMDVLNEKGLIIMRLLLVG